MSNAKGDEVDDVRVVGIEIKFVWQNNFQILLSRNHHQRNYKQIHYVDILLTTQQ